MKQILQRLLLLCAFAMTIPTQSWAQCAMCQATAESSRDAGSTAAEGLNNGVLYLLFMPIIFATIMFILWKRRERYLKKFEAGQSA